MTEAAQRKKKKKNLISMLVVKRLETKY